MKSPKILAPAGDKNSFLAALAAGSDAIYCGLKIYSARMEASNFSVEELSRLTQLAKSLNTEVFLALNSIIKESEIDNVFKILCKLVRYVDIKGLIIQDPALMLLAKQAGFEKEFHLSTLGNCTSAGCLQTADKLNFSKVVLPREFNIDEIKEMAAKTPRHIELESFIHGALCYSISGRCYWSSWFGGKSSLRGRCVQPCRRIYSQKSHKKRHFSCMDFSADVLVKVFKDIPELSTWKIEGRKKSPHYVYYTVQAYKLLRDDPKQKKQALMFLDYAMGREFTHYNLLTQRKMSPLDHKNETASGLFIGRIKNPVDPFFNPREALMPSDLIRIGFEGDAFHDVQRVTRAVPKNGKFIIKKKSKKRIQKGTPVYLIDRRDELLAKDLSRLEQKLSTFEKQVIKPVKKIFDHPIKRSAHRSDHLKKNTKRLKSKKTPQIVDTHVFRAKSRAIRQKGDKGFWISTQKYGMSHTKFDWLWLDPLLFPEEESFCKAYINKAIKKGAKKFVLNTPWQIALFEKPNQLNLWAGPFCNITNSLTLVQLKELGFSGAVVSPELDKETFLSLPLKSCLPLGVVLKGNWPLGISRIVSPDLALGTPFVSPKGETAWVSKFSNNYFIFPNWLLDISDKKDELIKAGYTQFIYLYETLPKSVSMKKRPGYWNWNLSLT